MSASCKTKCNEDIELFLKIIGYSLLFLVKYIRMQVDDTKVDRVLRDS